MRDLNKYPITSAERIAALEKAIRLLEGLGVGLGDISLAALRDMLEEEHLIEAMDLKEMAEGALQ